MTAIIAYSKTTTADATRSNLTLSHWPSWWKLSTMGPFEALLVTPGCPYLAQRL